MIHHYKSHVGKGGFAPATPGFDAVAPEWLFVYGATEAAPAIPAAESTLGSHPCVALSSAQVLPEWINRNLAGNAFAANGDNLLNFVSHARGSLHSDLLTTLRGEPLNLPSALLVAGAIRTLMTFVISCLLRFPMSDELTFAPSKKSSQAMTQEGNEEE